MTEAISRLSPSLRHVILVFLGCAIGSVVLPIWQALATARMEMQAALALASASALATRSAMLAANICGVLVPAALLGSIAGYFEPRHPSLVGLAIGVGTFIVSTVMFGSLQQLEPPFLALMAAAEFTALSLGCSLFAVLSARVRAKNAA